MKTIPPDFYPRLLDSIEEGVFTVDLGFRITSFNAAAERLLGISRERAVGRRCHEVFRATLCGEACALKLTVADGEARRGIRVDVLDAEDEARPISISTAALRDDAGRIIGGVEIFRDNTEIEELRRELSERGRLGDLVGTSPAMQEVFRLLPDLAAAAAPVLITGESGTGKELLAREIHRRGPRAEGPFVTVNAAALPDSLLESELFGYEKGAFTGAAGSKPGRFQEADGGTLFLDEIGDLSPAFQVKLLRALESGEVTPLGSNSPRVVDVRIITATNRDLRRLMESGAFREDLFYRLRVLPVRLPALRERRSDIPELIEHFRRRLAARTGRAVEGLTDEAFALLYDYVYPGNVRELRNILERAFALCHGPRIGVRHLPEELLTDREAQVETTDDVPPISERSDQRQRLLAALREHRWNRQRTAEALDISRTTLWRWMKQHGLLE
ncbi:MAG: PAS domain-containing protein [Candidatus Coatesbacteria bacterium]|nr:PAS domain-containing protein [Candidatus Coatesbacteria bacterium]